jgi:hypothetical protein
MTVMTDFDRLGWFCSWLAPAAWIVALVGFLLTLLAERQTFHDLALQGVVQDIIFVAAVTGLLAHTILALHVVRARAFSSEERRALIRALWLGFGYQRWRSMVRAAHQRRS